MSVLSFQANIETLQYHENVQTAEAIKVLMDMFHMRKGLHSTKGGVSSLTVADSMDRVGVHQLSGRGALQRNYCANTVGH